MHRRHSLLFAGLALAPRLRAAADPSGRWEGEAELAGGSRMPIVIDLARDPQGIWIGRVTLPGRQVAGAPLGALQVQGDGLKAQWPAAFLQAPDPPPTLKLRWQGSERAQGRIELAGLTAPLRMKRSGPAQITPPEPPSLPLDPALVGTWVGRYELGGVPRSVTLTLRREANGRGAGTLLIVGKRRTELVLDEVHLSGQRLRLQARAAGLSIEGGWSALGIEARLAQGPFEAALPLRRGDPA